MGFWTEVASFLGMISSSIGPQMICCRCGVMCPRKPHGFCGEEECVLFGADKGPEVELEDSSSGAKPT